MRHAALALLLAACAADGADTNPDQLDGAAPSGVLACGCDCGVGAATPDTPYGHLTAEACRGVATAVEAEHGEAWVAWAEQDGCLGDHLCHCECRCQNVAAELLGGLDGGEVPACTLEHLTVDAF